MALLLNVKGLYVGFKIFEGYLKVLNGVELTLEEGERVVVRDVRVDTDRL